MLYQLPNGSYITLVDVTAIQVNARYVVIERGKDCTALHFETRDAAQSFADALAKAVNEAKAQTVPQALLTDPEAGAVRPYRSMETHSLSGDRDVASEMARLDIGFGESG